ncbi:MAG: c-type cytochrome [Woeseia sp.]|nr:c-type cytochrome [Woeseia sp.]NNE62093.1 c-type cytochrome [Woeseia sp.]NNL55418.1 c-type cytochrome [Woeseia sp.]
MKKLSGFLSFALVAWLAGTGTAYAADDAVIPPPKFQYCTVCHGIQMGGNFLNAAPRLSGMDKRYVERQLNAFKNGWRGVHPDDNGGHEMRPMAAILSDKEISEVAKYVSAVDSAAPAVSVVGDAQRGKTLYASCSACHGAAAEGNMLVGGPALTDLNDWYQLTQLKNYKAGVRGNDPDDTYGKQMQSATALLTDEQAMQDVVHYIATLDSK